MAANAISRRSFVAGAAGAAVAGIAAAGTVTAFADEPAAEEAAAAKTDYFAWVGEAPVIADDEIAETVEADIVVVGGGNAGCMCACAAAEGGATVAVIESQPQDGIYYYGLHDIASLNSQYALDQGKEPIKKSEFIAEYQRRNHNRTNPRLIKKFADNSGEMIDWLIANGPAEVAEAVTMHGGDTFATYFAEGSEINKFKCWEGTIQYNFNGAAPTLIEQAESRGAKWYWETTGVVLVSEQAEVPMMVDQMDGSHLVKVEKQVPQTTVTGVIARDADGNYIKFLAKKGVVLTCGDFGGNPEMFEALMDEHRNLSWAHGLDPSNMINGVFGRDGSGIKMGMWVGASMDPVPRIVCSPNITFSSETYAANYLRWGAPFQGAECCWGSPFLMFDESGRRFTDETFMGVFGQVFRAQLLKPGRYYTIIDGNYNDFISRMAPEHFSLPVGLTTFDFDSLFASWLERGAEGAEIAEGEGVCAWGAQSLDELFGYMGLDAEVAETIKAEIDKYNGYCEAGEDEDFGRDPKMLLPIGEPPFFAIMSVDEKPMVGTVTLNGLVIDENQRVLDKNYNPIVGLYASGNNSGGRFALEYSTPMQGLTLGLAMTLGRELGKELAQA